MRRIRSMRHTAVGALAVFGLLAAACSDDDTAATEAAPGADVDETTTEAPDRTEAPELEGDPVKVGFINNEGGAAFSVPELRVGAEVGAEYVNAELGGVGGRPLELVPCNTDGSPESSIDCANQLIEDGVVAILEGTDLGADAILPVLTDNEIPMVGHVQFGAARMFDPNSYYFGAAVMAYGKAALSYYKDEGAQSVMWFMPDDPASRGFTDGVLTPVSAELGMDYQTVYYDPAAPNWSVLATTALAQNPDVSGSIAGTDAQCEAFIGALRDAGYQGRILAASCNGLYDALGDKAVGVDTDSDRWSPADPDSAPPAKQDDLAAYAAAMEDAGHEDLVVSNASMSFGDVVNLARIMSTIEGDIDGTAVSKALMDTKDFESFAGPTITCDHTVLEGNSACHAGLLFLQVQDDGSVQTVTDDFVQGA